MNLRLQGRAGFTLIEMMIVVAIIGVVMAFGIPTFVRTVQKGPMRESVDAVIDGLRHARAMAILHGVPTDFVVNEDYSLGVETQAASSASPDYQTATSDAPKPYHAKIHDDVGIELLEVNLQDQLANHSARVRFQPNGTSDEFTIVLKSLDNERRLIQLEVMTGLARLETDPAKFIRQ